MPGSRTVRVHTSRPSAALGDRSVLVPCGQCLGGGGSVNCTSLSVFYLCCRRYVPLYPVMVYTRAGASDYDDWQTVYENPGWGSNDLIPLLRKVGALGSLLFYSTPCGRDPCPCRQRRIKLLAATRQLTVTMAR